MTQSLMYMRHSISIRAYVPHTGATVCRCSLFSPPFFLYLIYIMLLGLHHELTEVNDVSNAVGPVLIFTENWFK